MPQRLDQATDVLQANEQTSLRHRWISYSLLTVIFFVLGYGASFLFYNWQSLGDLYLEASQARYEIMSGQRGPVTYLVTHNDLPALRKVAAGESDIMGVEQHAYSTVAKVAFISAKSPAIERLQNHPLVIGMTRRDVPMICH